MDVGLWFDDGNIVLIAGKAAFKVHKSLLARQASVFKDMFEVANAGPKIKSAECFEDCPSVTLQDPARDVLYFLQVLYDGFQCVFAPT